MLNQLKESMGDDFAALVPVFIASTEEILAAIEAAWRQEDCEVLRRQAHSLKSSSASLGGQSLSQLAAELEQLGKSGELPNSGSFLDSLQREFAQIKAVLLESEN